ncbi:hypothetical protein NUW54_g7032 [Trametes sanguinea]|uniref:Uncharacterized protein n=1 Tax=Trametes sanguinea TaxID=158606 RepID=A0ACC1PQL4_9APHY|nr:hypothetical protein NUW54_g7032 [Trametes sanguinea]
MLTRAKWLRTPDNGGRGLRPIRTDLWSPAARPEENSYPKRRFSQRGRRTIGTQITRFGHLLGQLEALDVTGPSEAPKTRPEENPYFLGPIRKILWLAPLQRLPPRQSHLSHNHGPTSASSFVAVFALRPAHGGMQPKVLGSARAGQSSNLDNPGRPSCAHLATAVFVPTAISHLIDKTHWTMDRPSLDLDILVHLMTFVDQKTLTDLMLISKVLNSEAAKERLRRGVQLFGPQAICSFLHFMSRATLHRLPYVRELVIAPGVDGLRLPSPLARQLAMFFFVLVIPPYGRVRTLGVGSVEELLRSDEALALAIARIPTIKPLTLESVGPHARRLFGCMQSQLLSADITIARPNDPSFFDNTLEPDPTNPSNPSMYIFGRSQETLCQLRITDSLSAFHCACYPNVTFLSLELLEMPRISDYIRAFPNLMSLAIEVESNGFEQSEMDVQRALKRREKATQGSWLNHDHGYPCTLYLLGITCPITSAELYDRGDAFEPALLKAALEDACLRDLALSITRGDVLFKGEFLAALSKKAVQNLRQFDLDISLLPDQDDNNVYVPDMLNLEDGYPPLNVLEEQLAEWDRARGKSPPRVSNEHQQNRTSRLKDSGARNPLASLQALGIPIYGSYEYLRASELSRCSIWTILNAPLTSSGRIEQA